MSGQAWPLNFLEFVVDFKLFVMDSSLLILCPGMKVGYIELGLFFDKVWLLSLDLMGYQPCKMNL